MPPKKPRNKPAQPAKPKPPSKPKPPAVTPGNPVPDSGIYISSTTKQQTTLVKGKTAPPTPQRNEEWRQKVDTNPNDKSSKK